MNHYSYEENKSTDISLTEIFLVFFKRKLFIFIFTSIFSGLIFLYSTTLNDIYISSAVLVESQDRESSADMGGLGALIDFSSSSKLKTEDISRETLRSKDFFRYFVNKRDILPVLLASESYIKDTKSISFNNEVFFENKWVQGEPNLNDLEIWQLFNSHVTFSATNKRNFITMSVKHISPYEAKQWLDWIIVDLNNYVSSKKKNNAENFILFLQNRLKLETVPEIKDQIAVMIKKQLNIVMLSQNQDDFLLQIIDSPNLPIKKSYPSRLIILIVSLVATFIFSLLIVLLQHYFKDPKQEIST
jgi:LPS O-antigen subunit length determinant protein (WzzB/FepE family)